MTPWLLPTARTVRSGENATAPPVLVPFLLPLPEGPPRGLLPQVERPLAVRPRHELPVAGQGQGVSPAPVPLELAELLARRQVPQVELLAPGRRHRLAVPGEGEPPDLLGPGPELA